MQTILDDPARALESGELAATIDRLVKFSAAAMKTRREELSSQGRPDDFKIDFKREASLKELASIARKTYVTYRTVES